MKEKQKRIRGVKIDERGGSVWCNGCGQLLANINPENSAVYLHLLCHCGNSGYLDLNHEELDLPEKRQLAQCEPGVIKCAHCGQTLFSVSERTAGFAFRVCCSCGEVYTVRHICKRAIYRELMEKNSLHNK